MKRAAGALVGAISISMASIAMAADVIRFTPGPYGGSKIITPWGDFIALPIGNTIWVGTVEEYLNNKADGVARNSGFKPVRIEGQAKNERHYVTAKSLQASVGTTELYQITTSVLFGVPPSKKEKRPPKGAGSEYVQLVWTPSNKSAVGARIVTADGQKSFGPNDCGKAEGFAYCEFTVGREYLTAPMMYVFTAKGQKPGVAAVDSVAKQHHKDIQIKYSTILKGVDPDAETLDELRQLHELDESIPVSVKM